MIGIILIQHAHLLRLNENGKLHRLISSGDTDSENDNATDSDKFRSHLSYISKGREEIAIS